MNNKPFISFILLSYNNSAFIKQAIQSALDQTYSPLEIIISDDASSDGTFEIIEQTVARYDGIHHVSIRRNLSNLGIGGNINAAMKLTRGALIVVAAGDDISLPNRTEEIYWAWENSGRSATSIFSSYLAISSDGTPQGVGGMRKENETATSIAILEGDLLTFLKRKKPVVNGCTHAWSRALFEYFGPLTADLEDLVLSFRSLSAGRMFYIDRPLVNYRRHEHNVSFFSGGDDSLSFYHREKRLRWVDEKTIAAYENILTDIDTLYRKGRISAPRQEELITAARAVKARYEVEKALMDGNFIERWLVLLRLMWHGQPRTAFRFLPRALPRLAYRAFYESRQVWRCLVRKFRNWERFGSAMANPVGNK